MIKVNEYAFVSYIFGALERKLIVSETPAYFIIEDGSRFSKKTHKQVGNKFNKILEATPSVEQEYRRQLKKRYIIKTQENQTTK